MPALKPTQLYATVTWLGHVGDPDPNAIRSAPTEAVELGFDGLSADVHSGLTRPSCVRVTTQYPEGTKIANARQLSVLSAEELAEIGADIGLEHVQPEWLGATLVIEGIPDFTHVPPSSRLQSDAGTCIVIDMHNRPCVYPAKEIEKDKPGHGKAFLGAAKGKRGVTAWVERPGPLKLGDKLRLHVPDQRAWAQDAGPLTED
ncbi:MAG: sulfurase [Roseovarius sp.]